MCQDAQEKHISHDVQWHVVDPQFFDAVSGEQLDPQLVKKAREDERRGILEHGVFTKTSVRESLEKTGVPAFWPQLNLVCVNLDPKVPFLNSFFEASAGFQN